MHHSNTDIRRAHGQDRPRQPMRPRSPHDGKRSSRRSPHGDLDFVQRPECLERVSSNRHLTYLLDRSPKETVNDFGMHRARSRHRSRGPGAVPIDRSEPFESDAAEQRLRKLRERLNLVDDAIAEIKAGAGNAPAMNCNPKSFAMH